MKKKKEPKIHKVMQAEIVNDLSLRWHGYQRGELLLSDELGIRIRFDRYEDGKIRAMDYMLRELPNKLEPLKVRREVFEIQRLDESDRKLLGAMVKMRIASKA